MKRGICPKCGARNVHTNSDFPYKGKVGFQNQNTIPVARASLFGGTGVSLNNYICVDCGYVESYIHGEKKLKKVSENWNRVVPK